MKDSLGNTKLFVNYEENLRQTQSLAKCNYYDLIKYDHLICYNKRANTLTPEAVKVLQLQKLKLIANNIVNYFKQCYFKQYVAVSIVKVRLKSTLN